MADAVITLIAVVAVVGCQLLVVVCCLSSFVLGCRRLSLVVVGCGWLSLVVVVVVPVFVPPTSTLFATFFAVFVCKHLWCALALACFSYVLRFRPPTPPGRQKGHSFKSGQGNQGTQNLANATQNGLNVNIPPTAMLRSRARKVDPPLHRKPSSRNVNTPHAKNSSVVSH